MKGEQAKKIVEEALAKGKAKQTKVNKRALGIPEQ
jgi:hypothetical protein